MPPGLPAPHQLRPRPPALRHNGNELHQRGRGKEAIQELRLKSYVQLYGQSEIVFVASGLLASPPRYTSIGRLGMGLEAMVVDTETGNPLGPKQQGELVLRGPGLMRGYWGRLDDSVTGAEGWYGTGDECYFDDEGWLYLVQRTNEFIVYRDTKIPPACIEAALLQCPEVKDCAVVGLPHPDDGHVAHAVVVAKPESRHLGPEHYLRFVNESVPKELRLEGGVTLVDEIPRNKLGKLVRRELLKWVLERSQEQLKVIAEENGSGRPLTLKGPRQACSKNCSFLLQ